LEDFSGKLIYLAIDTDHFESFVEVFEIFKMDAEFDIKSLTRRVLMRTQCRKFKYLLNHQDNIKIEPKWMLQILWQMEDQESDIGYHTQRCFHILLNHRNYNVNEQIPHKKNQTALHFAAIKSSYATVELLKKGASLDIPDDNGQMAIQVIDRNILKQFFDSCIAKHVPGIRSDYYYMVFDYSFLNVPTQRAVGENRQMPLIEYIAESKNTQSLIEHPVIASFLFLKWSRLTTILVLNLWFSLTIGYFFSNYLLWFYVNPSNQPDSTNQALWLAMAWVSLILFSLKECILFSGSPTNYLKSYENYFEIAVICLMTVLLLAPIEDQKTRRAWVAVFLLGFAIELTLVLSTLPVFSLSNYFIMLKKVTINFVLTILFYSIILMAFAFSFYTLINNSEESTGNSTAIATDQSETSRDVSVFSVIYQVVLMLTGEFGNIGDRAKDIDMCRIFLLIFVFSMSIVMMNLLIGITVSDTAAIMREAEMYTWRERTKVLGKFECMMCNW
jgi:transient receptor potential cation channel subfamily A member 1